MPHIHTRPGEHDHTASAFIVRSSDEPKIVLHVHKLLGKYLQFGGHIELNENPWQSVIHEVREESGYDMSQLKILQPASRLKSLPGNAVLHPYPIYQITHEGFDIDHKHIDTAYAFVTAESPKYKVADNETGLLTEFSRSEILNMPGSKIAENVREACLFVFDECLPRWDQVDPSEFET